MRERPSRLARADHNPMMPYANDFGASLNRLIRRDSAMNRADERAKEDHIDVGAAFVLQVEAFLLYDRIAVHR
jgi:hypothetical protein